LDPSEAEELLADPNNADVVKPFLNGHDLNTDPHQSASRWVIFFRDWEEDRAREYEACFKVVEDRVKPDRRAAGSAGWRKRPFVKWWQFREIRPTMFRALKDLHSCFAIAVTSKTVMPVRIPVGLVPSHAVVIFASMDSQLLAALSSSFHYIWALNNGSTLRADLRYTPTSCFETFPIPQIGSVDVIERLEAHRAIMMTEHDKGLTGTYNDFHAERCKDADTLKLRHLHVELDNAIANGYGWSDLQLDHGFHDTPQGSRYTICAGARSEALIRLLDLNSGRHTAESLDGLHTEQKAAVKKVTGRRKPDNQLSLDDV
jgi:hypothetical protein